MATGIRERLLDTLVLAGELRTQPWRDAMAAVPRQVFLPEFFRQLSGTAGGRWKSITVEESTQLERLGLVHTDSTWVIQLDHTKFATSGCTRSTPGVPTAAACRPGLVARMLEELHVRDGHRVLEIGTGTGYSAAVLCQRLGNDVVTTIEVHPEICSRARESLYLAGYTPHLVRGEALCGYLPDAPYNRVIAFCSVRSVPSSWINQTRIGGMIVAPIMGRLGAAYLARVVVTGPGRAEGRFLPGGEVGILPIQSRRSQSAPVAPGGTRATWVTAVNPLKPADAEAVNRSVVGAAPRFIAQLAVSAAQTTPVDRIDGDEWVTKGRAPSLLERVEQALADWHAAGAPSVDQFRLSIDRTCQTVWYGEATGPLSWRLPGCAIRPSARGA